MSRAKPLPDGPSLVIKDAECFALLPDGKHLAVARANGAPKARLVELATGRDVRTFSKVGDNIRGIAVSHDGGRLAFGQMVRNVFLCNDGKGTPEKTVAVENNGELMGLCFAPKTGALVHGTWDAILMIDPSEGEVTGVVHVLTGVVTDAPHFHRFSFSRKGDRLAVAWSMVDRRDIERHYVTLFSWPAGEELQCLELKAEPRRLAFSPDGSELFIGREDGTAEARGLPGGKRTWKGGKAAEFSMSMVLAVSPDGALLVFGHSSGQAGRLEIWDQRRRKRLSEWALSSTDYPYDIGFTTHGRQLILALDRRIEIHQVSSLISAA